MKTMVIAMLGFLLTGCAEHYPYADSLAKAEHDIATAKPEENVFLYAQARGETWVRYTVVYGEHPDQPVTNGTAMLHIEHGKVSISGPDRAQATIKRILEIK